MRSVTTIINAISYVLIAFVSISLVVSSIMIGIITYISVLERTKEIGILRAIGASKHDIARVFNAETLIEGLIAGLLRRGTDAGADSADQRSRSAFDRYCLARRQAAVAGQCGTDRHFDGADIPRRAHPVVAGGKERSGRCTADRVKRACRTHSNGSAGFFHFSMKNSAVREIPHS